MACGACGSRAGKSSVPTVSSRTGGRTLYQVVLNNGDGAVAFQTNNVKLARTVRENYKTAGAVLVPDPGPEEGEEAAPSVAPKASRVDGKVVLDEGFVIGGAKTSRAAKAKDAPDA